MKRFVTYLYEYERGHKSKNTGFVRVDIRGNDVRMEVSLQNCIRGNRVGKIYAIVKRNECMGIELGEIKTTNGQGIIRLNHSGGNLGGSDFSIHDVIGISICFDGDCYLASCWNDEDAEEMGKGDFHILRQNHEECEESLNEMDEPEVQEQVSMPECIQQEIETTFEEEKVECHPCEKTNVYKKIELNEIRSLPSANWHYCNNSFLVHGFWNYGYLVIKKEMEEDKEKISLGIPGIFEKPELVMAVFFGFPEFEAFPQEVIDLEMGEEQMIPYIEKNQEPKVGTFGCWFVELQV